MRVSIQIVALRTAIRLARKFWSASVTMEPAALLATAIASEEVSNSVSF
jgi:hypothetical protein